MRNGIRFLCLGLALAFCLLQAGQAWAERLQLTLFSVEVPDGWTWEKTYDGGEEGVWLSGPGKKQAVAVGVEPARGRSFQQYAEQIRRECNGTPLQYRAGSQYDFTFYMEGRGKFKVNVLRPKELIGDYYAVVMNYNAPWSMVEKIVKSMQMPRKK